MNEYPRTVFIHAPARGREPGVFHVGPRRGYTANVEYVRADLVQHLVGALRKARPFVESAWLSAGDGSRREGETLGSIDEILAAHESHPEYVRADLAAERDLEHVGWQQRYLCPDEGPSIWASCSDKDAEVLARRDDYEVRKVYTLATHNTEGDESHSAREGGEG